MSIETKVIHLQWAKSLHLKFVEIVKNMLTYEIELK